MRLICPVRLSTIRAGSRFGRVANWGPKRPNRQNQSIDLKRFQPQSWLVLFQAAEPVLTPAGVRFSVKLTRNALTAELVYRWPRSDRRPFGHWGRARGVEPRSRCPFGQSDHR